MSAAGRPDWARFAAHYDRAIRPGLAADETERAKLNRWRWIARAVALAVGLGLFAYWGLGARDAPAFLIAGGVIALGGLFGAQWIGGKFEKALKWRIVSAVARHHGLLYQPEGAGLNPHDFRARGVVGNYDRARLEDGFNGVIDGLPMTMTEARLQVRRRRRDSKGRSRTTYVTVFQGLLIRSQTPARAPTTVRILRDGGAIGNAIGGWFRERFSDDERIRLEDPAFEKRFEVYAADQLAARLLLTPTMLERFRAFADAAPGHHVQAAFEGTNLWIAIDTREDLFETGGLGGALDDPARAQTLLREIAVLWDVAAMLSKLRFNSSGNGHPPEA